MFQKNLYVTPFCPNHADEVNDTPAYSLCLIYLDRKDYILFFFRKI